MVADSVDAGGLSVEMKQLIEWMSDLVEYAQNSTIEADKLPECLVDAACVVEAYKAKRLQITLSPLEPGVLTSMR